MQRHLSIQEESCVLTHHTGIPASFSRLFGTVTRRGRLLNFSLATGQGLPMPVFVMCACGGTCGFGHVWRAGGRDIHRIFVSFLEPDPTPSARPRLEMQRHLCNYKFGSILQEQIKPTMINGAPLSFYKRLEPNRIAHMKFPKRPSILQITGNVSQ